MLKSSIVITKDLSILPKTWKYSSLKDLIIIIEAGKRPRGGGRKEITNGIPSIEAGNLTPFGGFDFSELKFIPQEFFATLTKGKIKENDILVVKDGATTGKVSFIDENFPFKVSAINEHLFLLRVKEELVLPKYLFYYLYSKDGQQQIRNCFVGSAQGGINRSFLKKVFIPLPPLEEQKRIVAKLDDTFTNIEKARKLREEALKDAEQIMQSALHEVFSKAEEKGWKLAKLGDKNITKMIMGQSPSSTTYNDEGKGLPFFQGKADFGAVYPTTKKWCTSPLKIALPYDILISVRAPVGPVNICKEKSCIGRGLAAIRANENSLYYKFLFYQLRFLESMITEIGKGSTFGAIGRKDLESRKIYLPKLEEQKRVAKYLDDLQEKVVFLKKHQEETQKEIEMLTSSILNKAFMGEL